jgi:hypothetical protein
VRNKKIVFAPQDKIRELRPWVQSVLEAIGHPEAWVSDQSSVGDFCLDDDELAEVSEILGVPVEHKSYIHDLAQGERAWMSF